MRSSETVGDRGHFDEFVFAAPGSKDSACDEMEMKGGGYRMEYEEWDEIRKDGIRKDGIRKGEMRRMKCERMR